MKCQKCEGEFPEHLIHSSHDVPCYIFKGITRQEKKPQADKFPRHYLCEDCHEQYEEGLRLTFQLSAMRFSSKFFEGKNSNSK